MIRNFKYLICSLAFIGTQGAYASAACLSSADLLSASVAGGDKTGNGGIGGKIEFRAIADEFLAWVRRTELQPVNTGDVNKAALVRTLLTQSWRVCFNDDPFVSIAGSPEHLTCRNSFDPADAGLIECSGPKFAAESVESRWYLVGHELLGRARAENNIGKESNDFIAKQLRDFIGVKQTAYFSDQIVVRSKTSELDVEDIKMNELDGVTGSIQFRNKVKVGIYEYFPYAAHVEAKLNRRCSLFGKGLPKVGRFVAAGEYAIQNIVAGPHLEYASAGYVEFELVNQLYLRCARAAANETPTVQKTRNMLGNEATLILREK